MDNAKNLLAEYIDIKSSKVFYEVVEYLRDLVSKGLLKEVSGTCSVLEIEIGKLLPDDLINC